MYRFNKSIWFCLFVTTAYAHAQNTFPATGNVGIGTTAPGVNLDVISPSGTDAALRVNAPTGRAADFMLNTTSASGYGALKLFADSNEKWRLGFVGQTADLQFGTMVSGWVERMRISATGNVGIGTTSPAYNLDVVGAIRTQMGVYFPGSSTPQTTPWTGVLCGGDYAEAVEAAGGKKLYEPGDVLVLTAGDDGDVQKSLEAYSTMVAGIFATKPGVIGKRETLSKTDDDLPMAMVGIVPTKVTAENGPIRKGDLLVTSSNPGYAMKGTDRNRLVGAVLGKAMGSLQSGVGVIEVLVTLQ